MKIKYSIILFLPIVCSCEPLTNDAYVPISLSFSDGGSGECELENKRYSEIAYIPNTPMVRRSDDGLRFKCKTKNGGKAYEVIPSTIGAKILASAVFLDFGITDAITDKHREYPASYVIPVR